MAAKSSKREHGTGSVWYRESDGRWVGRIRIGYKPNGKPDYKVVYGKTEKEANKKLQEAYKESLRTDYVYIAKDTLESFLNLWLTTIKSIELKPKSYDRLEQTIENDIVPSIGKIQLAAVTSDDVQRMINTMQKDGRSLSTIKKAYQAIGAAFKWGLSCVPPKVKDNPAMGAKLPSSKLFKKSEIRFYTQEEAKLICDTAMQKYKKGTPWYPLGGAVVLLINTGLRLGEAIALEWDRDIDLDNQLLYVRKNIITVKDRTGESSKKYITKEQDTTKTEAGQDRVIPLNADAILALESLKKADKNSKYVLATRSGARKSARDIDKLVRRVAIRAGFPEEKVYGPHSLRHTFATLLLNNGVDIKTVSELLGHSDISVTYNTYIHVIKENKVKALSLLPNFISDTEKPNEKESTQIS